ncbi:hypothetical protein [Streptomyces microflavus]|uniref:hypothetical protein n=1 Tax=Streptomyces microflavus TaxID=1919 RepID=UPI002E37406C|nr:hypothetical protein [Streptomyces microflavus]
MPESTAAGEAALVSALAVDGVSERAAQVVAHTLHTHGLTLADVHHMSDDELMTVPGIWVPSLNLIRGAIKEPADA